MVKDKLARWDSFVSSNNWIFARTYAKKSPHWYVLRGNCQKDFDWAVRFIRINGKIGYYLGYKYIYFSYNDYKYWTMGVAVENTIVINRANI